MHIIEIDITNACDKRCSNCTRLCGHHKKPYFMDFETFKRAVDSLDGFQGSWNLMGGEPTLHPEFERFVRYLASKFPKKKDPLVMPQKDFIRAIHRGEVANYRLLEDGEKRLNVIGPGLCSNMGASYRKHYELINDVMCSQILNDHVNPCYHQPALVTRKELGISDDEWPDIRDACWLQNQWSAGITPKGAFFCEIAGVLDMLLDGPGGWPIEPGWWKRTPEEFGDQLHWCELCGFCLNTFSRDSAEEIDDMTPSWYERLKALDSPKLKSGRYNIIEIKNGTITEECKREKKFFSSVMPYYEHYEDRFSAANSALFIKKFTVASIPDGPGFGVALNKLLAEADDWLVLHSANAELAEDFAEQIGRYVLNPGTMHYIDLSKSNDTRFVANAGSETAGYAALFNKNALSLREFGFDRIAYCLSFAEILAMWQPHKVAELSSRFDDAPRLSYSLKGMRYAVWGTGATGSVAAEWIVNSGGILALAVDQSRDRQGCDFFGTVIQPPKVLTGHSGEYDLLLVANYANFLEIAKEAQDFGVPREKIRFLNSLARYSE